MKHKHYDYIVAWAEGKEIQCKDHYGDWITVLGATSWSESNEYRIKPRPFRAFREVPLNGGYILRFYPSDTGWMSGISNEMMDAIEEAYK
jgi:hypothetical protein